MCYTARNSLEISRIFMDYFENCQFIPWTSADINVFFSSQVSERGKYYKILSKSQNKLWHEVSSRHNVSG